MSQNQKKITFKTIFTKNYPENRINGVQRKVIQKTKLKKNQKFSMNNRFHKKLPNIVSMGYPVKILKNGSKKLL